MKIILEGCDGTGKTTLAKLLAEKYGLDICHCTAEDPKDFTSTPREKKMSYGIDIPLGN